MPGEAVGCFLACVEGYERGEEVGGGFGGDVRALVSAFGYLATEGEQLLAFAVMLRARHGFHSSR